MAQIALDRPAPEASHRMQWQPDPGGQAQPCEQLRRGQQRRLAPHRQVDPDQAKDAFDREEAIEAMDRGRVIAPREM